MAIDVSQQQPQPGFPSPACPRQSRYCRHPWDRPPTYPAKARQTEAVHWQTSLPGPGSIAQCSGHRAQASGLWSCRGQAAGHLASGIWHPNQTRPLVTGQGLLAWPAAITQTDTQPQQPSKPNQPGNQNVSPSRSTPARHQHQYKHQDHRHPAQPIPSHR